MQTNDAMEEQHAPQEQKKKRNLSVENGVRENDIMSNSDNRQFDSSYRKLQAGDKRKHRNRYITVQQRL